MVIVLEKILSNLFFLFFVAQILSPSIGDKTFYLEILVAVLNPFFILWVKNQPIKKRYFFMYVAILIISLVGNISLAIKLFAISIGVLFLYYSYDRNIFYIKPYITLSLLLAIFQLYFTFFNPELATMIGPTNIAQTIWGSYATATFTNFYTVFWFPRVSGLSREAGFLASFLVVYILFLYLDKDRQTNVSLFYKILLTIGYIISFSKMSLVLFGVLILNIIKNLINKLPVILTIILFVLIMIFYWDSNTDYLLEQQNVTFLHRFGGYPTIFDLNLYQLIFGISDTSEIKSDIGREIHNQFQSYAGFSGFIIHNGILVLILIISGLYIVGISSTGILILLFLTINVQLDTNQNFVVLSYFIILKFFSNRRIIFRSLNANN